MFFINKWQSDSIVKIIKFASHRVSSCTNIYYVRGLIYFHDVQCRIYNAGDLFADRKKIENSHKMFDRKILSISNSVQIGR